MTFDREPDLDNANVGMPDTRILGMIKYIQGSYQIGSFLFYLEVFFMVKINGEELDMAGKTLAEYLAAANYDPKRIVIERNEELVPKAQYGETILQDGDIVEVVSFVGGG